MGLLGFPAATGLALVATPLATVMVGADFREGAAQILPWIAIAALMNGLMTYYFHEAFILRRKTRWMAGIMAAAALFNLALNIVLIPLFGIAGAAAATLFAYTAGLLACALVGHQLFPLPLPWLDWGKALAATAGMAVVVIALPVSGPPFLVLVAKSGAGALAYASLALALNIADCRSWIRIAQGWLRSPEAAT
jgi:O-antigen/teichoic acid export membrane protein